MEKDMRVTVLICTYNRHLLLRVALRALMQETIEKPDQIVVVNGGDEQADTVIHEFANCPPIEVKLVKTVNINLATSRNVGLEHCDGDIVAMTDDDAEVFPDWITQIKRLHSEHPEAGAIGGAVIGAASEVSFLSRLSDIITFPLPKLPTYVRNLPGVNVSYKRVVLDQIGKQDAELLKGIPSGGDDVDFNWRVKHLGYEVLYHPDVKVLHHHRPSLQKMLKQHYFYGRAYYLVRRKWPDMYCVYPSQLKRVKDLLKAIHFVVAIFYQPVIYASKMRRWTDRILAVPLLALTQVVWKWGMLYQAWLSRYSKETYPCDKKTS